MKRMMINLAVLLAAACAGSTLAGDHADLIASAERAGPPSVTTNATIKTPEGKMLREGSNGYTCYPGSDAMGPMCNPPQWDGLIGALMGGEEYDVTELSISYMLAGDGESAGVSNSDPFHPDPASADDFVREGPHLMILVPDNSMLEGISRNPDDAVYVMWGDTPYAHIMVKITD